MPRQRDPKTGRWMPLKPINVLRPTVKVFVFGTLKRGHGNHRVLGSRAQLIGTAETTARYRMFSVGFPVIIEDGDGHHVRGELYDIPPEQLVSLDQLESEGRMYHRKVVYVTLKNGGPIQTYIYVGDENFWRHAPYRDPVNEDGLHEWNGYRPRQPYPFGDGGGGMSQPLGEEQELR
jgi:gamma-glutamylcyclotransferase (GGCT)/AIG2-like uncharacterized protein YtfP